MYNKSFKRERRRSSHSSTFSRRPSRQRRVFSANSGSRFKGKYIDPLKFVNKSPSQKVESSYLPKNSFSNFGFIREINQNLSKSGFKIPTRIQDESISSILQGRDLLGLANTGSGKTGAFILPIIQKLNLGNGREKALIIAPTRELAGQIEEEFLKFSKGLRLYSALCVGGLSIHPQKKAIARGANIVIGTPGRLKDLVNQRSLHLETFNIIVLDEVDRILDMGFVNDIRFLVGKMAKKKQSLCFSATISAEIQKILDTMLVNPVTVSVRTSESGEHIAQDVIRVRSKEEKFGHLSKLLKEPHFKKVLIFGEMKHSVQKLAKALSEGGFRAEAIHGNKSQAQRQRALRAFKEGKVNILVATDVAARGLDIPNVSHVINFDTPNTYGDYIHRIGRTGRAGKGGQAYTFVH